MPSLSPRSRRFVVSLVIACSIVGAVLFGAVTRAEFDPATFFAPSITATKTDAILADGGNNKADPGEVIRYTTQINNGGPDPATGVAFNDTIDPNTTLVGGSVNVSPLARDDSYSTIGNTLLEVGVAATGFPAAAVTGSVFDNDTEFLGDTFSLQAPSPTTSANGGTVAMNANGSFTYLPPVNFTGTDTFTYTIVDSGGLTGSGTVSISVTGRVWYVRNNAASGGTGRSNAPFDTLVAAQTASSAGDTIYIHTGDGTTTNQNAGVILKANQRLIGQGVALVMSPYTLAAAGTRPTIGNSAGNGITLATDNTVRGLNVGDSSATAIAGPGGPGGPIGTLNLDTVSINTTGRALNLSSGTAGTVIFTNITSSGGTNNVILTGLNGTWNLGTGAMSGASSSSFQAGAGTGIFNYSGTITSGTGRSVDIQSKNGGSVNFSGLVTDSDLGINLVGNAGSAINFTGGITASTGAFPAFAATGGGTVSVTGSSNTLTTTTATALNISNTNIGVSGVTFRSISANGATSGIVLNTTGTTAGTHGGLTVTGTGTTNASGGTIQNTSNRGATFIATRDVSLSNVIFTNAGNTDLDADNSGLSTGDNLATNAAIHLQSVTNATLNNVDITGGAEQGINGNTVSNFVLSNSTITDAGNGPDEDGIHFFNMSGTSSITGTAINCTVVAPNTTGGDDHMNLQTQAGTLNLTISGSSATNANKGSGFLFGIRGTTNATITFNNSSGAVSSTNNFSGGIVADAFDNSTMNLTVANVTSSGNNDQLSVSAGDNSNVDLNANNNTLSSVAAGDFVVVSLLGSALDNGFTFDARIQNNIISLANGLTADGISVFNAGGGMMNTVISNNTITYAGTQRAILVQAGQDGAGALNTTITGNFIDVQIDGAGNAVAGMLVQAAVASPSGDNAALCADIGGSTAALRNTFTHSVAAANMAGGDIRARQRFATTVRMPGYPGTSADEAAVVTYLTGRNTLVNVPTATSTNGIDAGDPGAGGFVNTAGSAPCTQPNPAPPPIVEEVATFEDIYQKTIDQHNTLVAELENLKAPQLATGEAKIDEAIAGEAGVLQSISNFANRIFSIIIPTASAQNKIGAKPMAPMSGEAISITIGVLPAGKGVTIVFNASFDGPSPSTEIITRVVNQATISGSNFANVITSDPTPDPDPACSGLGTATCTPVDRPDTTVTSVNRVTASPTNLASVQWRVTFANPVGGLAAANLTLTDTTTSCTGETLGTVTSGPGANEWTVNANTGTGSCTLRLDVANSTGLSHDVFQLPGSTPLPFITGQTIVVDKLAPSTTSFTRFNPATSPTNADTLVFQATFSENVINVDAADFAVTGTTATVTGVVGVGVGPDFSVYNVTVSGGDLAGLNGTVGLNFSGAMSITDLATNALPITEPATDQTYLVDNAAPTVNIVDVAPDPRNVAVASIAINFSENVTGFDIADLTLTRDAGANLLPGGASVTGGAQNYTLANTATETTPNGSYVLTLAAPGGITDTAGNALVIGDTDSWVMDAAPPTVTINQAVGQSDPTFQNPINFTAIFNEPVTDFDDVTDVVITGTAAGVGTATKVITPVNSTEYTIAVSGITGDGTVIANIPAGVAIDAATNQNLAATPIDNQVTFVTCTPPPPNMRGWYSGDGTARDIAAGNDGTISGNVTYAAGKVGQTFRLGGNGNTSGVGDRVTVGNPATYQSQDFTIDAWIRRSSATVVTNSPVSGFAAGTFFAYGANGYGFLIDQATNRLGLTKIGVSNILAPTITITDTNFHHVAVTKSGNQVIFYVDGVATAPVTFSDTFTFGTNAAIGARGDNDVRNAFFGDIDELEVFNSVLTPAQIQAIVAADGGGKCKPSDLRVAKTAVGTFTQGQAASYTIAVSNDGPQATAGTVSLVDTLPGGLTATSLTGAGWTCVLGTLTCTRTDALPSGAVYPDITLGVTVAQNSPLSVINTATASGGGEMDTSDSFDSETTAIVGVAQTPSVTGATTVHGAQTLSGLVITPNAGDGAEVTHYKITNIQNGTLFQNNGTTAITAGSFITRTQGLAGLKFTPNLGFVGNATFDIQASVSGVDGGLGGTVITATIVVNQANTITTITSDTPDPSVFGGNVAVNFTVVPQSPGMGVPTGNVVVTVSGGAETCTGTVAAGTCTLALNAIGARTLTATYGGNTFFIGSNDTEAHQVNQAATTTTITADTPDPSVTGQIVAVNFTVTANTPGAGTPTGNVNVTVSGGAETCTGTVAAGTCNITLNSVGSRTLTATYVGDTNFTTSNDTETHTVSQAATTTTTVSDLPDASVVGQPVTITYTVMANGPGSGTPTGNVVLTISGGSETCTGTVAAGTCNITLTSAGARTLTATYQGDANYLTSLDTEPHQVNQAATSFTVVNDTPDPTSIDQTYTVSWTLAVTSPGAGTPTGTVTVSDGTGDSCTATLPTTSCTLNSLTQGTKTLTYTYSGDSNFLGATNNATTHVVNCTPNPIVQNDANGGAGSLRKAVADACAAAGQNTVTFNMTSVVSPISLSAGEITLVRNVIVQGPGSGALTVQNTAAASPTSRIFTVNAGVNAAVSGLTLTGGNTTTVSGGAISNAGTLTLTNAVITGNTGGSSAAQGGGGIFNEGTVSLISSTLSNNIAGGGGGGIFVFNGGTTNVTNSTISGNSSTGGGAILSQSLAPGSGGLASALTITNSTLSGNVARSGNVCGGVWVLGTLSTGSVVSSTITNNEGTSGGGICANGPTTVRSSIVAGNVSNTTVPDVTGAFTSQGYNLIGSCPAACSASGFTGTAEQSGTLIAPLNPQIGALANNGGPTFTHALLPISPAVDKGINAIVPLTTDQRGELRPFDIPSITPASGGDNTDIGSYELNTIPTTLALASSANPSVFGQNVTFTATVATVPPGGTVTGNIDFSIDGNPVVACQNVALVANQATCSTAALSVGAHTIFADFDENLPFLASNATMTQNVNKANTTTAVTAAPASSVFGQAVTFTATVGVAAPGAGTPTGTVTFTIDGTTYCANTPLTGLTATCTQAGLPALPAGARNVVATYNGDGNFNTSSGSLIYTVNKASTTTTIVSDLPDPSLVNQPYTVTWAVAVTAPGTGTPTGTVTVNGGTGGGTCTAAVAAGSCQLTPTTTGVKTISATYNGDNNFNTSTSATTTHTVNVGITGTVRNGLTLAPISGVSITLYQLPGMTPITTATTNAAGLYTFSGIFTGPLATQPTVNGPPYYDPVFRNIPSVATNVSGQDFLQYVNVGDIPRTLNMVTQYVVPGQAGSMPFILNSQDNEVSVAFSISYDINPFAQPPTFVCGAQAPGCTITQDTSVLGRVGVTIVPAGGAFSRVTGEDGTEAPGLKEIARMNFQTLVTPVLPSTPIGFEVSPTNAVVLDNGGNPLLTVFGSRSVVFVRGNEGDVAGRNAGSGTFDAADVVQTRRFVAGLDAAFVNTFNEFQRADTAPGATKGNGVLDATDVIQTRRYVASLDAPQLAGGAGFPNPGPIAPPSGENPSEIIIGTASATNNTRISVPVGLKTNGRELAASFTVRYDEERFGDPTVELANGAPEGVTLTLNKSEPGVIRIVIDSGRAFGVKDGDTLLDITLDVKGDAPSGEAMIEVEDLVFSDAEARATRSKATTGTISIAGPNPAAEDRGAKSRDRERRNTQARPDTDLVEIWLNKSSVVLKRPID